MSDIKKLLLDISLKTYFILEDLKEHNNSGLNDLRLIKYSELENLRECGENLINEKWNMESKEVKEIMQAFDIDINKENWNYEK